MSDVDIQLPGSGARSLLAAFDLSDPQGNATGLEPLLNVGVERWLAPGELSRGRIGRYRVRTVGAYRLLSARMPLRSGQVRSTAANAYRELLAAVGASDHGQLLRIWNYVPGINDGDGDAEVYRQFCWGRAEAFDKSPLALPAATAIGCPDDTLRITALTATAAVTVSHLENPRQVSAYRYPRDYGPRSPSFARATHISMDGQGLLLVSGTSSIVAHETRHPEDLVLQTIETRRNIDELLGVTASKALQPVQMRYYLRNPQSLEAARSAFRSSFTDFQEPAYLRGDICRAALLMEIDAVFRGAI